MPLPAVFGDVNNWGTDLNNYLLVGHDSAGHHTQWINAKEQYGAVGNGVTDDSSAINSAITAASNAGGGVVWLPPATYAIANSIVPKSNVTLMGYGATLLWTGATSSNMIANSAVLSRFYCMGLVLNAQQSANTVGILLESATFCLFRDMEINNGASSGSAIGLHINSSGSGSDPEFGTNSAFNVFQHVQIRRWAIALQLDGLSGHPTTDNRFYGLHIWDTGICGINFVQYCDNNYFYGTWVNLAVNGATGIILNNSGTPAANTGVYGIHFYGFAIDAGAISGATGLLINFASQCTFRGFYWSPAPTFNGTLVNDAHGDSYVIEFEGAAVPYTASKRWRDTHAGTAPTLGALQSGVSTQTLTPAGYQAPTDRAGVCQIVTAGASPPGSGAAVAVITFADAFANAPTVMLTNQGVAAGTFYATTSTTGITVRVSGAGLAISTTYQIGWSLVGI